MRNHQSSRPVGGAWARLGVAVLLLDLLTTPGAAAPLRWRWCHPEPHGNNIKALAYSESRELWVAAAEQGTLYTSRDGFYWIPRDSGTRKALRSAAFLGSRILVTGEEGVVLYADNEDGFLPGQLAGGTTANWLEGVAAAQDLAVAVGDEGAVYRTSDGIDWTLGTTGVTAWLRDVAYGHGRFVAVGEGGTVITSDDGSQWLSRPSGVETDLNRVSVVDSGFLVVGSEGVARFSADGESWVGVTTGAVGDLFAAGMVGSDTFVAGDNELRVRVEGQWLNQLSGVNAPPAETYLSSVSLTGSLFLAGRTGLMVEGFRQGSQMYEWALRTSPDRPWLFDMVRTTNLFVAVGEQSSILSSVDGLAWSFEFPPTNYMNAVFLGVGGTTNLLVGAGNAGALMVSPHQWMESVITNGQGLVVTQQVSSVGVIWHAVEPPLTTLDLQGVTYWGGHYYVCGDGGIMLRTVDGIDWTTEQMSGAPLLSGLAGDGDTLVAVGDAGALLRSADGVEWQTVPTETTNWIYKVRYLDDRFVAVGEGGTLFTSNDGESWVRQETGTTAWLTDATRIRGATYVTGTGGTVLRSTDGVTWVSEGSITLKALFGAVADEERLLVCGTEGVVLRSPLALGDEPVSVLKLDRALNEQQTRWENLYLFGGKTDQQFTLDRRAGIDEGSWEIGPRLEILESGGTLLYLESVAVSNAPPSEYYRTTLLGGEP